MRGFQQDFFLFFCLFFVSFSFIFMLFDLFYLTIELFYLCDGAARNFHGGSCHETNNNKGKESLKRGVGGSNFPNA